MMAKKGRRAQLLDVGAMPWRPKRPASRVLRQEQRAFRMLLAFSAEMLPLRVRRAARLAVAQWTTLRRTTLVERPLLEAEDKW